MIPTRKLLYEMMKNLTGGDSRITNAVTEDSRTFRMVKLIILTIWFAGLIGIRLLMASLLALEGTLVSTVGSIGIIFVAFYLALKYTPLSKYTGTVNSALLSWFNKRYFMTGVASCLVVLSSLIFLAEYGYQYHSENLVFYEELRGISSDDENALDPLGQILSLSTEDISITMLDGRYGLIGTMSIIVASVDKSLGGYYVKAVSFILAENVEVLIFLALVRRSGRKGLFGGGDVDPIKSRG